MWTGKVWVTGSRMACCSKGFEQRTEREDGDEYLDWSNEQ